MKRKEVLRVCLIVAVIAALVAIAFILYFRMQNNVMLTDGTLI